MSLHHPRNLQSDPRLSGSQESFESLASVEKLFMLDALIGLQCPLYYKGGDFSDHEVVQQFVNDHRPLNSAMLGTLLVLYQDPCICRLPPYGEREWSIDCETLELVLEKLTRRKEEERSLDLLFVSESIYRASVPQIKAIFPDIAVIVGCDHRSTSSASSLRKEGIPAIDDQEYLRCSPLNAMIALLVFGELMSSVQNG